MDNKVLQIILCFFIPPLAVYLKKGNKIDNDFWINVVLTLFGGLPGLLHGLYIVLK